MKQITEIKTHSCADKDCGIISAVFLSEPAIKNKNVIAEPESNLLPEIQKDTGRSTKKINTQVLVLAAGHSARDTLRTLYSQGLELEQKPFSIGVRIEHPQSLIDIAQYGKPGKSWDFLLRNTSLRIERKKDEEYTHSVCVRVAKS